MIITSTIWRIKWVVIVACCVMMSFAVSGQEVPSSQEVEDLQKQKIENYSEQTQSELDITEIVANLEYYQKHPINLNNTNYGELASLGILDDIHIKSLLDHIQTNGKFLTLYELQTIVGFDVDLIAQLLPYVRVSTGEDRKLWHWKDMGRWGMQDVMMRYQRVIEKQKGYGAVGDSMQGVSPNSSYLGSADKVLVKYRFNYINILKIGLTAEKDAGEDFGRGSNPCGFDFYSGYINVNHIGILKSMIVGDYGVQFGQGLTLWTGSGFGKGSDAVGIKKMGRGISGNNSVYENGFMRGGAFTVGYKQVEFTGFYSRKKMDGNRVNDTLDDADEYVSSLPEDGLHNTVGRVAKEKTVREQIFGGHLSYKTRSLHVGLTGYGNTFDVPLIKEVQPYDRFEFSGTKNFCIGMDYSYILRNFNFFGETSRSGNGGIATLNGLMASINTYVSVVVSYRYYQRNYQSLYSAAFSQSNSTFNETGFYTGIVIKPHYKILLSAYADIYTFPWLKYQVQAPSTGYDFNVSVQYKPTKKIQMDVRYKYENRQKNCDDAAAMIDYLVPETKQSFRVNISYPISKAFTLSNRIEAVRYSKDKAAPEAGYFLSQDVRYRTLQSKWAASFRFAIFDTKSYNSRVYMYENDVLYAYSFPVLYGKGIRYYLVLQRNIGKYVDVWLRFAQTFYNDRSTISSGLNEIDGNTQSEIKVQVRVKF